MVARAVGAVAETVGDGALLLAAGDPSYVAAARAPGLHRRGAATAVDRGGPTPGAGVVASTPWPPRGGGRGDGGGGAAMKVAFVTPRYGPQVMGGAETAARQLAEHLVAETAWEAEAYSTCALDPHTWADELEPGDTEINGVPVHRFAVGPRPDPRLLRPRRAASAWPRDGATARRGPPLGRLQRSGLARPD